jgi:transcription initiation factor TFIIB
MEFNQFFEELDKLDTKKESNECCLHINNYIFKNELVKCKHCDTLISNISDNPEWRYYGSEDTKSSDPTRCGMPINILLPKSSVGSIVSNQFSKDKSMFQVKKYTSWNSMTYKERSTYKVFSNISDIAKKNNLSQKIVTEAKSLYKIISDTQISRGNNRKGIIAACLYYACKNCNVSRSSKEIGTMFKITTSVMTKGTKTFQEIIHMSNSKNRIKDANSINPEDFIDRFCNKLNLGELDIKQVKDISKIITSTQLISEVRPDSIAAGCILFYCNFKKNKINKKEISNISQISEVTINKCSKKIEETIEIKSN